MDVFLINLDRDRERLAFMDAQLRREGVSYRRFAAIAGADLSPEQAAYHQHPLRRDLSRPEIGCLLSHIDVWRLIVAEGLPCALVLEDDIHLAAGFGDLVRSLQPSADAPEVQRLETVLARVTTARVARQTAGARRAVELFTNHAGAAAYVLTQAGARLMLDAASQFTTLPDGEMFDFGRRAISGLTVVQWTPAPCLQDRLVGAGEIGLGSHLEAERHDTRSGYSRPAHPAVDRLKRLLRPVYTAAYDARLRLGGRARVVIPFG